MENFGQIPFKISWPAAIKTEVHQWNWGATQPKRITKESSQPVYQNQPRTYYSPHQTHGKGLISIEYYRIYMHIITISTLVFWIYWELGQYYTSCLDVSPWVSVFFDSDPMIQSRIFWNPARSGACQVILLWLCHLWFW